MPPRTPPPPKESAGAAQGLARRRLSSGKWAPLPRHPTGRALVELPEELPPEVVRDVVRYLHGDNGGLAWMPALDWDRVTGLLEGGTYFVIPELLDHCHAYLWGQ